MANREPMMSNIGKILVSEEMIQKRVKELGEELTRDYAGKDVVLVCNLKGACVFYADLARSLDLYMKMDFMSLSSYGDSFETSGIVKINKDLDTSITDKHVIIVEDIMDSGLSLSHLKKILMERKPASLKICCMLDKPERRECDITPDYTGFTIPNEFVVGYGLDYTGEYRNLPFVGVLKPEVYAND